MTLHFIVSYIVDKTAKLILFKYTDHIKGKESNNNNNDNNNI